MSGYKLKEPAGVAFDTPGWHLVGVNGASTEYTAESLLDSIDTVETLDADNVTKWGVGLAKYEGLQKESDTSDTMQVYGFDYPIRSTEGYFVRIVEGSGTWTPE